MSRGTPRGGGWDGYEPSMAEEAVRKSDAFLLVLAGQLALAGAFAGHALVARGGAAAPRERSLEVARRFQLTDLNLFNEARYTRHLSQADLHTAFQDHPVSLEHFPSGALTRPRPPAPPGGAGSP